MMLLGTYYVNDISCYVLSLYDNYRGTYFLTYKLYKRIGEKVNIFYIRNKQIKKRFFLHLYSVGRS